MTDSSTPQLAESSAISASSLLMISPVVQSAARWFWWIAGLSLINTIMLQSGSNTSFVMGLGFTAVSDALFDSYKYVGFAIDAMALGLFVLFGYQARIGKLWAFYAGITLYALDAIIYVIANDWMPVAFHCLALFFLSKGAMALIASRQKLA